MDKVIIINTPWEDDYCFIGECGELTIVPTDMNYGEIKITKDNKKYHVNVDYKDYVPFSLLMIELF